MTICLSLRSPVAYFELPDSIFHPDLTLQKDRKINPKVRKLIKINGKRKLYWRSQLIKTRDSQQVKIGKIVEDLGSKLKSSPTIKISSRSAGLNAPIINKFEQLGLSPPQSPAPAIAQSSIRAAGHSRLVPILAGLSVIGTGALLLKQQSGTKK